MFDRRIEGYWYSKFTPQYPMPVARAEPWEGQAEFLVKLAKKEARAGKTQYRGMSTCRCCKQFNGSSEYHTDKWAWPSGLRHYIEEHNVKPSDDFIKFVMG